MKIIYLIISILMVTTTSCQKDDDLSVTTNLNNPINTLNQTPITIIQSSFVFNNGVSQNVDALTDAEIDDNNFVISNITSSGQFAISLDDTFFPNGAIVLFKPNETSEYIGHNFTIIENENSLTLTGQVSNGSETKDLEITLQESQFEAGDSEFEVLGHIARISGTLGSLTYNQILQINAEYPNVNTIELGLIDGSINDEVNVQTGRLIREAGYRTHLKSNSMIFSGGVDLFCSGKYRTMEAGAVLGVHSWCCYEGLTADQLPEDSEGHIEQLDYFTEMLGETKGRDFYFFTINSAPFDDMYQMTTQEINQFGLITE